MPPTASTLHTKLELATAGKDSLPVAAANVIALRLRCAAELMARAGGDAAASMTRRYLSVALSAAGRRTDALAAAGRSSSAASW